ncbi:MAG: gfo/Idh/MocA family oxidoreductase, partial [Dysosmobacter sp.]|nr:gfo/Idh/MocA family oxidoreductase [Dysosmobacter sp.]
NVYVNVHTSLFADMSEAIEQDRNPYVDSVAGRNALEMILAIYQSAAAGKPVKLPLKGVASTDFEGRFSSKD